MPTGISAGMRPGGRWRRRGPVEPTHADRQPGPFPALPPAWPRGPQG